MATNKLAFPLFQSASYDTIQKGERSMKPIKRIYNSRYWSMLAGLVVPILNQVFDWNLPPEQVIAMVGLIAAFILGESYRKAKNGTPHE